MTTVVPAALSVALSALAARRSGVCSMAFLDANLLENVAPGAYYALALAQGIPPNHLPRAAHWERPDWYPLESASRHGRIISNILLMCDSNRAIPGTTPVRINRPTFYISAQLNPFICFIIHYLFPAPWDRFDRVCPCASQAGKHP